MDLTLYTETYFDSAHFIQGHEGKCAALHGHTWKVCLWIKGQESQLDANGILWDFGKLKKLCERYDHRTLNEVMEGNPTAERLVSEIYRLIKAERPELGFRIRVYENIVSRESWCEGGDPL
jgi:6-pyruvoyltetrahydropterin/6-carboxytetrahydropterin synthase